MTAAGAFRQPADSIPGDVATSMRALDLYAVLIRAIEN
jgi:hypothetical protein